MTVNVEEYEIKDGDTLNSALQKELNLKKKTRETYFKFSKNKIELKQNHYDMFIRNINEYYRIQN